MSPPDENFLSQLTTELTHTSIPEILAFTGGILQVYFAYRNKRINFYFGIFSVCIYTYLFFQAGLLAESILNIYYLIISIYGLIIWQGERGALAIANWDQKDKYKGLTIFILCFLLMLLILFVRFHHIQATNYMDALVTAFAFAGSYLLMKRRIENWIILNISNLIAIPLQYSKGLILTSVLTFLLFIMAILGYFKWRKEMMQVESLD